MRRLVRRRDFVRYGAVIPYIGPAVAGNAIDEQHNHSGLAEVPEDLMLERMMRNPVLSPMLRQFAPGTSPPVGPTFAPPLPQNDYKSSVYPFLAQTLSAKIIPANPFRAYFLLQNNSGGGNAVFVNFGADASAQSIKVIDGGNLIFEGGGKGGSFCPPEDVYVIGAVANMACVIMEGLSY